MAELPTWRELDNELAAARAVMTAIETKYGAKKGTKNEWLQADVDQWNAACAECARVLSAFVEYVKVHNTHC